MRPLENSSLTLSVVITGIILGSTSQMAQANVESGKAWLANAINGNSRIANNLQTKQEIALTLSTLQSNLPANDIDFNIALETESSSEGLVRLILLDHQQGDTLHPAWQQLINNQNTDGGFAHVQGWQSNPLDTAFVLIALDETGYLDTLDPATQKQWQIRIAKALIYLSTQQQTDGSYQISHLDELYTSSYVLSAFTPYLGQYGQYIANAQALVAYLESKQTDAGTWSTQPMQKGLFLDALVADSLYPYQSSTDSATFSSAFSERVLALQSADGSWQQDGYVTALVLRALDTLSKPVANPLTSGISFSIQDNETKALLSDVTVILTSQSGTVHMLTDKNGFLLAPDLTSGDYIITLNKPGYIALNFSVKLRSGEFNNLSIIKLSRSEEDKAAFIQGEVTDQTDGRPVVGASVKIYFNDKTLETVTNNEGRYQISTPYTGSFSIEVTHEGYNNASGSGLLRLGEAYNFSPKLETPDFKSTTLIGKVIDENGKPIHGAKLYINNEYIASSNVDGTYRVDDYKIKVTDGYWLDYIEKIKPSGFEVTSTLVLNAQYEGYVSINREIMLEENAVNDLSTTIMYALDPDKPNEKPPGMVPGTVNFSFVDKDTKSPLQAIKLHYQKVDSDGEIFFKGVVSVYPSTKTVQFTNGRWKFFIQKRNYEESKPVFVNLAPNATENVIIEAKQLGVGLVNLKISEKGNEKPIYNASIVAEKLDDDGTVIDTLRFDLGSENSTGRLDLAEGKWRIYVSNDAYEDTPARTVTIEKDSVIDLDFRLSLPPYSVNFEVIDSLTNEKLTNAKVTVYHGDSDTILYESVTDAKGKIEINDITVSKLRFKIQDKEYLGGSYFFDKQFEPSSTVDLGEIRLRPKSAQVILPDLKITELDTLGLATEQQSLVMQGELVARISNEGNADVSATPVYLTAFVDANENRQLDADEQIMGQTTFSSGLAQDEQTDININISGKVDFRDAPIAVIVDSTAQVAEEDEENNVRLTSDGVEIKPEQGTLESQISWENSLSSNSGAIAAPLQDSNGDGVIGQGDIASIIVLNNSRNFSSTGKYYVIDGLSGKTQFILNGSGNQELVAVGDVDVDGLPEIVVTASDGIRVYSNTGELKKTLPARLSFSGWSSSAFHPIIADLNKDGIPEIIQNNKIFTYADGLVKDSLPSGQSQGVADLDGDGYLDIIGLSGVATHKGELLYNYTNSQSRNIGLKFTAVGDVLNEGTPQIIAVYGSDILIIDALTGQTRYQYRPTSSQGGSPVIADFDGDGVADIGVARTSRYVALRGDGSKIWSTPINDGSGGTGSTVFDFDNDGKTEAVHFDEYYLRIYDAATGVERIKIPNRTPTAHEYPIVGDFDADGHADIVITSKRNGIRMISSKNKDWANTRNIWNQYSYHVTNINDDLSVPQNEPNSWEVHNTYRANLLLNQNATAASDLTASYLQITDNGTSSPSTFTARIGNAGGKPVKAGTPISFYRRIEVQDDSQATLIGTVTLSQTLAGGDYQDISLDYNPLLQNGQNGLADFGELIVVANDAGAGVDNATGVLDGTDKDTKVVQEYTRSNNVARIAITGMGGFNALTLVGEIDKTHYTANETVTITSIPTNLGSFPTQPDVRVSIIDNAGNAIEQFADTPVDLGVSLLDGSLPKINSTTVTNTWNTAQNRTGNYTARIELILQDDIVASVDRPFAIVADGMLNAPTDSQIYTDKTTYLATDLVELNSRLINTASNAMATQRSVSIEVKDADGRVIWSQTYGYEELAPNAVREQFFTLPLTTADAGDYTVTQTTVATDGSQSQQIRTVTFKVLSVAESGLGVSGTIDSPATVDIGETIDWQWSVKNDSTVDLDDLPLSIVLYKNDSEDELLTLPLDAVNLNADGTVSGKLPWETQAVDVQNGDRITAILVTEFSGVSKGLATTQVALSEPPIDVQINAPDQLADTLLIYYSCAPGWHTAIQNFSLGLFENECFDQRAAVLTRYLDRIDVPYKLVKRPEIFADELQSGKYAQYWLLGAIEELRPHIQKELTELTYRGDNLLIDGGMNSWRNQDLYPLAGAKHEGRVLLNTDMLSLVNNYISPSDDHVINNTPLSIVNRREPGNAYVSDWVQWLKPLDGNNTQIWATVNGQRKRITKLAQRRETDKDFPAIISQKYGNGMPIATAFDVIGSLDMATTADLPPYPNNDSNTNAQELRWDTLLTQWLTSREQTKPTDYVPNEVVRIPIEVNNPSRLDKRVLISVDLPAGSEWLGYDGGITDESNPIAKPVSNTISYRVNLSAGQSLQDVLTLRLPAQAGTHAVRVTVSDITQGSSNATELEQNESRYLVRDIESRLALIESTVNNWDVWTDNGFYKLHSKTQIGLIKTHLKTGARQLAVYEAANLATTLATLQQTDDSDTLTQLRYEVDDLLKALQIDWYIERDGYIPPA